jgi:hypothetical protein
VVEKLILPVGSSGGQPVEHRQAKAYFSPELKVYGKMWELTASGSGPGTEFEIISIPTGQISCLEAPPNSTCRL